MHIHIRPQGEENRSSRRPVSSMVGDNMQSWRLYVFVKIDDGKYLFLLSHSANAVSFRRSLVHGIYGPDLNRDADHPVHRTLRADDTSGLDPRIQPFHASHLHPVGVRRDFAKHLSRPVPSLLTLYLYYILEVPASPTNIQRYYPRKEYIYSSMSK